MPSARCSMSPSRCVSSSLSRAVRDREINHRSAMHASVPDVAFDFDCLDAKHRRRREMRASEPSFTPIGGAESHCATSTRCWNGLKHRREPEGRKALEKKPLHGTRADNDRQE